MTKSVSFDELPWRWDAQRVQLVAAVELDSWSDYAIEDGHPDHQGAKVLLCIPDLDIRSREQAHRNYASAVEWLFANEQKIHDSIVEAVYAYLPTIQERVSEWGDDDPILDVETPEDLRDVLNLADVHIFPHRKGDLPYLGFDFDCDWDAEHGFKVLLNGTTVVAVEAEACDFASVEKDGGRIEP